MKKTMFILLAAAMLGTSTVQAMTQEEAVEECKALAADDGISAEEMDAYIKECVDSLVDSAKSE